MERVIIFAVPFGSTSGATSIQKSTNVESPPVNCTGHSKQTTTCRILTCHCLIKLYFYLKELHISVTRYFIHNTLQLKMSAWQGQFLHNCNVSIWRFRISSSNCLSSVVRVSQASGHKVGQFPWEGWFTKMAFIIEKEIFTQIFTLSAQTQQRDNFTILQWHNQQHRKKRKP